MNFDVPPVSPVEAEEKKSFREKFGDRVEKIKTLFGSNKEEEVNGELSETENELEDKMREYDPNAENDEDNKEPEEARELRCGKEMFGLYEKFSKATEGIVKKMEAFRNSARICLEDWGEKRGTETAREDCEDALGVYNSWRKKVLQEDDVEKMEAELKIKELPDDGEERLGSKLGLLAKDVEEILEKVSENIDSITRSEEAEDFEEEDGVESQETDKEIVEKIVSELTEELESDVESFRKKVKEREDFGRDENTGEIKSFHLTDVKFKRELLSGAEEELKSKKEEIRKEARSIFSMNEARRGQLKQFLEQKKQEAETQSGEFNRLYKRRLQMIEISEEAKREVKEDKE